MPLTRYVVLPDSTSTDQIVTDPVFTEVSDDGDVYISFRIVQFTHSIRHHPEGWNYLAKVHGVHIEQEGVGFLKIEDKIIQDCRIERFDWSG